MKTKILVLILVTAGIIAASVGFYQLGVQQGRKTMPATPSENKAPVASAEPAKAKHERKILYWQDPMVPTQKFDKPGKSPFMDMELEPVYADDEDQTGDHVTVSNGVQQNLGIRTADVTAATLAPALNVVGSVAYNERDMVLVQARANGYIEKLYVRATLDSVKKGQALAELYVPDWVAAQEEFLTVSQMGSSAPEGLVDAARQRMRLAGMTEDQIHQVETKGKTQARLTIYAPSGGVISELNAREGMTVNLGAPLFRINGLGSVWVNAEIPENAAAQVKIGSRVEARTSTLPNTVLKGRVSAILPQVDSTTRTLQARIELANPSGKLIPGMFANISLANTSAEEQLVIPTEAIIRTGKRSVVMRALDGGKFKSVDVETGLENDGMTEIISGLKLGQKVVISGQFLIDSEASLRSTTQRMGDPTPTTSDKPKMEDMSGKAP